MCGSEAHFEVIVAYSYHVLQGSARWGDKSLSFLVCDSEARLKVLVRILMQFPGAAGKLTFSRSKFY